METLEHMLSEARKALAAIDEAQGHLQKIGQIPLAPLRRDIVRALTEAGERHDSEAFNKKRAVIDWAEGGARLRLGEAATEVEVLRDIADDLIGKAGRLV